MSSETSFRFRPAGPATAAARSPRRDWPQRWATLGAFGLLLVTGLGACDRPRAEQDASAGSAASGLGAGASAVPTAGPVGELGAEIDAVPFEFERIGAGTAFDPSRGILYVWGGGLAPLRAGGRPLRADPSVLEAVDLRAAQRSTLKLLGTVPTGVHLPAAAWDGRGAGVIFLFGGWPELGPRPTDALSRIELGAKMPAITPVAHAGDWPSARNGATVLFDAAVGTLYLFGGDAAGSPKQFLPQGELWRFVSLQQRWEKIQPAGDVPPPRWHAAAAIDDQGRKAYLFGGAGSGAQAFDARIYELDLGSLEWHVRSTGGDNPPSLQGASLTYDPSVEALLLAGGLRNDGPPPAVGRDLYVLDLRTWRWRRLDGGDLLARRDHAAAYDPGTTSHYLVGGHVSTKVGNFYETGDFVRSTVRLKLKRTP